MRNKLEPAAGVLEDKLTTPPQIALQKQSRLDALLVKIRKSLFCVMSWLRSDWERGAEIHNRMKAMHDERHEKTNYFHIR